MQFLVAADLAAGRTVDGAQAEGLLVRYAAAFDPSSGWAPIAFVHGFGTRSQHRGGDVPVLARSTRRVSLWTSTRRPRYRRVA